MKATLTVSRLKEYSKNKEFMWNIGCDENSSYDEIYNAIVGFSQTVLDNAFGEFDEVAPTFE